MSAQTPEDIRQFDRWFAVESNNLAWELSELPKLSPANADKMLHAAHAAAFHWSRVGTELNLARADLLLGQVYALLGNGALAMKYAQPSFNYLTGIESPDWEVAFAHAVLAHAAYVAEDLPLYIEHHSIASTLGEVIADPGDQEIFQRTFRRIPAPAAID